MRWITTAVTLPVLGFMASCACPDDEELNGCGEIDLGGWEAGEVVSGATGERYSYLRHASGRQDAPVMILVPGLLFDERIFVNLTDLAQEFTLVAWHMPEDSSLYKGSNGNIADALKDFVDAMGLERIVLAGTSLGGQVCLEFFKIRGDVQVDGLVLVSTSVLDATPRDRRNRIRGGKLLSKRSDRFISCTIKTFALRAKKKMQEDDPQRDVFNIFRMKEMTFFRQVGRGMLSYDGDPGTDLVTCPTLVLHGTEDQLIDVDKTAHTVESIPHARLEIVQGAGHEGVFSEAGTFASLILDWWAEARPAGAP